MPLIDCEINLFLTCYLIIQNNWHKALLSICKDGKIMQ